MSHERLSEKEFKQAKAGARKYLKPEDSKNSDRSSAEKSAKKKTAGKKKTAKKGGKRAKVESKKLTPEQAAQKAEKERIKKLTDEDVNTFKRKAWYRYHNGEEFYQSNDLVHTLESAKMELDRKGFEYYEVELRLDRNWKGEKVCPVYRNLEITWSIAKRSDYAVRADAIWKGLIFEDGGVILLSPVPPPLLDDEPFFCDREWEEVVKRSIQYYSTERLDSIRALSSNLKLPYLKGSETDPEEHATLHAEASEQTVLRDQLKHQLADMGLLEWDAEYADVLDCFELNDLSACRNSSDMMDVAQSQVDTFAHNPGRLHSLDPRQRWVVVKKLLKNFSDLINHGVFDGDNKPTVDMVSACDESVEDLETHFDNFRQEMRELALIAFQAGMEAGRYALSAKVSEAVLRGQPIIKGSQKTKHENDVLRGAIVQCVTANTGTRCGPETVKQFISASSNQEWKAALHGASKTALKNLLAQMKESGDIPR